MLRLGVNDFQELVGHSLDAAIAKNFNMKLVQTVKIAEKPLVSLLPKADLEKMVEVLEEQNYVKGEAIIEERDGPPAKVLEGHRECEHRLGVGGVGAREEGELSTGADWHRVKREKRGERREHPRCIGCAGRGPLVQRVPQAGEKESVV